MDEQPQLISDHEGKSTPFGHFIFNLVLILILLFRYD